MGMADTGPTETATERMKESLLILLLGSTAFADQEIKTKIVMQTGRFQITQLSDYRRDQYLVDTQTGRIWQNMCVEKADKECVQDAWIEKFVENNPASKARLDLTKKTAPRPDEWEDITKDRP